jgi:two-component system CheB/CheR fusion protein
MVDKKHKIYSKKPVSSRLSYDFGRPYLPAGHGVAELPRRAEKLQGSQAHELDIQVEADRIILKNHSPAGVIVNRAMEIVHFRGRTAPYLEPPPGKPSLNVVKLARNGLAIELRTLIGTAIKKDAPIEREGVSFNDNRHPRSLNLLVTPLGDEGPEGRNFFLVLFDDVTPHGSASTPDRKTKEVHDNKPELKQLRQDLASAQEALRSAIESEDALREEFQSANEEILSANEELQSTNEELETSKGDAALTRRASKYSGRVAVVVRFSRPRGRYERKGILVETSGLEKAERECLEGADERAVARARGAERRQKQDVELAAQMIKQIAMLFPGCPAIYRKLG